MTPKRMDRVGR